MNKEQIHDAQISPLMDQIIAVCKEHNIACICSFAIPNEEDETLRCTTHLGDENGPVGDFAKAHALVRLGRQTLHLTTEHADGSKTLTAIL